MYILEKIAEQKIKKAIEAGELDDLPRKGQKLEPDDLTHIPAHLRMGLKILKNANMLPREMQLKKEIASLKQQMDACTDEREKTELQKQHNETTLKYNIMMEKNRR